MPLITVVTMVRPGMSARRLAVIPNARSARRGKGLRGWDWAANPITNRER